MSATLTFKDNPTANVVTAEVLYKGKAGAAQLRAVVPVDRLKKVLSASLLEAIKARTGKSLTFDQIQGHPTVGPKLEGACSVMGRRAALTLMRQAASSPGVTLAKKGAAQASRKRRILQFVALGIGGGLVAYGGWRGLEALLARRRAAQVAALKKQGVPEDELLRRQARAEQADKEDLSRAAQMVEERTEEDADEEDEEDEESDGVNGFSLRRVFGRRKGGGGARRPAARAAAAEEGEPEEEATEGLSALQKAVARHAIKTAVPGGGATLAVAQAAHKKNPALSKSATRLAKARGGDPRAKKEIKVVRAAAAQGHPGAKAELTRLHTANTLAKKVEARRGGPTLFERGVAGDVGMFDLGCQ